MTDIWNERIKTIFAGLKDLLVAAAAIIAAWQSVNNNTFMRQVHAENQKVFLGGK